MTLCLRLVKVKQPLCRQGDDGCLPSILAPGVLEKRFFLGEQRSPGASFQILSSFRPVSGSDKKYAVIRCDCRLLEVRWF